MVDIIKEMIQYAEEFGEPSMKKLNQMDIKEIFNFMDNFLLDQDISSYVDKEFLQNAITYYEVRYTKNHEIESIKLTKHDCDCIYLELNILGIFCTSKIGHNPIQTITRLSWKYLKDIMFKD